MQALAIAVVAASQRDGVPPPSICARIDIDPALLGRPDVRLRHSDLCRAWTTLAIGDDAFGLRVARLVDSAPQSLVEYVLSSARDVRSALRAFVRFQTLIHDVSSHRLDEGPAHASFRFALAPGHALPHAVWDYLAATIVLRLRRGVERFVEPLEVRLPRPPFEDEALARDVFRAPIAYRAERAEVRLSRALLDARMSTTDSTLHALLTGELERALGLPAGDHRVLPHAEEDVLALVRRELRTALPQGDADLVCVARTLRTSARSLQRRLRERGTSFQALVDDTRRALAEELLAHPRTTVTETAFATGFSNVAAFTRAFRRWTGRNPGERARPH